MARYEITILAAEGRNDPMQLADRCVIEADSVADAAARYSGLFIKKPGRADDREHIAREPGGYPARRANPGRRKP